MSAGIGTAAGLALLSGGLLVLCFPRFDLAAVAWVALVPLLLALEGRRPLIAYLLSGLAGVVFFVGIFAWIWTVPGFNLPAGALSATYLAQYLGLWGLGLAWIRSRTGLPLALVAPPLWVTLEYVRSNLSFLSLPWMLLGHSQYLQESLIQATSLAGVYGLSLLIVLVNAALAEAALHLHRGATRSFAWRPPRTVLVSLALAGVLVGATVLHGRAVLPGAVPGPEDGDRFRIALVQGNIPQDRKWDRAYRAATLERYQALTLEAARQEPAVIIWPETAVPGDLPRDPELRRAVARMAAEAGRPLLVGTAGRAKSPDRKLTDRYYNSMVLVTPDGKVAGEYRKIWLVPFGEYEPLQGIVRWPAAIVPATGPYVPGDRYTLFDVGTVRFAATICWENIFPDIVRTFVKRGARFVVNATNEAWFHETAAAHQFLAVSAFRAAENRVAVARAGNTGISAVIDPFGRITDRIRGPGGKDLFVEGTLTADIPISRGDTFYTRYGDVFAFLVMALTGVLGIGALWPVGLRRGLPRPAGSGPARGG